MYLEVQNQKWKIGLNFWRLNDGEKGMSNAFNGKKLRSKLCVVYFDV